MEVNLKTARKVISLFPPFAFMTYQSHAEDVIVSRAKTWFHPTILAQF